MRLVGRADPADAVLAVEGACGNHRLGRLLKEITGHLEFRQLEASWLGLEHLLNHAPADVA